MKEKWSSTIQFKGMAGPNVDWEHGMNINQRKIIINYLQQVSSIVNEKQNLPFMRHPKLHKKGWGKNQIDFSKEISSENQWKQNGNP